MIASGSSGCAFWFSFSWFSPFAIHLPIKPHTLHPFSHVGGFLLSSYQRRMISLQVLVPECFCGLKTCCLKFLLHAQVDLCLYPSFLVQQQHEQTTATQTISSCITFVLFSSNRIINHCVLLRLTQRLKYTD